MQARFELLLDSFHPSRTYGIFPAMKPFIDSFYFLCQLFLLIPNQQPSEESFLLAVTLLLERLSVSFFWHFVNKDNFSCNRNNKALFLAKSVLKLIRRTRGDEPFNQSYQHLIMKSLPLLIPNWWIKRDKPFSAPLASWEGELNWICMDSAEQHIHLWRAIMLAGAPQDLALNVSSTDLKQQHLCVRHAVCCSWRWRCLCLHGSLPRNSICRR